MKDRPTSRPVPWLQNVINNRWNYLGLAFAVTHSPFIHGWVWLFICKQCHKHANVSSKGIVMIHEVEQLLQSLGSVFRGTVGCWDGTGWNYKPSKDEWSSRSIKTCTEPGTTQTNWKKNCEGDTMYFCCTTLCLQSLQRSSVMCFIILISVNYVGKGNLKKLSRAQAYRTDDNHKLC